MLKLWTGKGLGFMEIYEQIFDYLKKISGLKSLNREHYLVADLHLSSKEIIDFAIYFFNISGKKISLAKDININEILNMCVND